MKIPDLSETPLVRKYGPRGARWFARIWFPVLYAMLAVVTAGFWIIDPQFPATWPRILIGFLVTVLVIVAASILTRMRLQFFAGIEQLEAKPKAGG
ncbi:MAG TPA: hypothetical protein VNZ64_17425 [Candidatus Acidoferrum sp.]|nr:hypothetical protein [Candidatus Acidoferrum sp.]